jgi:eukaryotic-like serine/threonine-protein kinase
MSGQTIGDRYALEQPLGGGAMGSVWLAHDLELERKVAVKVLAKDADRARFEREAHAVAGLSHPNICQLYDYGESDRGPYMVLEYLPGGTLEDRLAAGRPLPDEQAFRVAAELAAGLAHAHGRGLVHRDLKPSNILFDGEGRAKIADFGIARIEGGGALTEAGTVLGTAAYLSPEQAAGEPATPASDVYSFGVIVFRMLTGRTPFVSNRAMELVRMHRDEQPPTVEEFRTDAPPVLAGLTLAALAKTARERPADGAALVAALEGTGADTTSAAAAAAAAWSEDPPTQVIRRARPARRRRAVAPLVLAAAAVLAIVGAAAAYMITGSDDGGQTQTSIGSLDLPTVGRESTASSTASTEQATAAQTTAATAASSTEQTATEASSTRETTTQPETTTTRPTTAQQTTTRPVTVPTTTDVTIPTTTPVTTSATTSATTAAAVTTAPATTAVVP